MTKVLKINLLVLFSLTTLLVRAQVWLPVFDTPTRLGILSTESEEIAPVPFSSGQKLYFVRSIPEGNAKDRKFGQEIWTSERIGGSWSAPQNVFSEANDLGNNGVIGSSADGNKIYVFNSLQSRRKLARGIAFVERQDDGTWSDLKKLDIDGFEIGDGYYSFYINQSEDVLLISMAPDQNTINEDLYVSVKNEQGNWSVIQSLGEKINTPGVELSPFITEDKNVLYFASNGHGGEGEVDIFVSYRLGDGWKDWTMPKNLGPQINSKSFDGYFTIGSNEEVFFVSDRDSAMGDIYSAKLLDEQKINGQFLYKGLPTEDVTLEVYDVLGNLVVTVVTDSSGKFSYRKLKADEAYYLKVSEKDLSEYAGAVYYELDQNGNKSNRNVLSNSGLFVSSRTLDNTNSVAGTFKYKGLPLENSYLLVLNNEGDVVDTILTDANGKFVYKKLNVEGDYTFKPLENNYSEDVIVDITDPSLGVKGSFTYKSLPLQNEALLVLDNNGEIVDTIYTDNSGNFSYTKLNADNNYSFKPLLLEDNEPDFNYTLEEPDESIVEGTMVYKKLPLMNTPLLVKDKSGLIVDTIYTDAYGKFNFKKLKADEDYSFEAISTGTDSDLVDVQLAEIEEEQVKGAFKYKSLPLQNEALVVLDENGFPMDTIYTDENGLFEYKKLKGDLNYTVKLLNEKDIDEDDLIMVLNTDDTVKVKQKVQGVFKYKNLPLQNEALIVLDENGLAIDTIYTDETGKFQYEKLKGELNYTFKPLNEKSFDADDLVLLTDNVVMEEDVTIKEDPESVSQEGYSLSNSIYFNFNEVFLTKGDYAALDKIIENKEKIREVILEGHTDNLGSEETNMKVAKLRIESAANYLIKRGLDKNIIKRIPFGERKPIEDNSTKEGRAKNRRVVSFCN